MNLTLPPAIEREFIKVAKARGMKPEAALLEAIENWIAKVQATSADFSDLAREQKPWSAADLIEENRAARDNRLGDCPD